MFLRLLLIACLAMFVGTAVADDLSMTCKEVYLTPEGSILNSLDDPEEDTLYYDDDTDQFFVFTTLSNYYTYVRFSPPSEFTLRSAYVAIDVAAPGLCSLWVHLPGASNRPGTQLISTTFNVSQSTWYDVTLPDSHTFSAGQDFLIVIGRAPGPTGWRPFLDGAATQNRTRITTGARMSGTYQTVTVDARIRAGGHFAPFTDLAVSQCFNEVQGRPQFNFLPNNPVLFKAEVRNPSNQRVDEYTVTWQVRNSFGDLVFTNEAAGANPVNPGAVTVVTATQTYTPTEAGEYMATAILDAQNDANANNDTTLLRMFIEPLPRYLRYDDNGDPEGSVTFTDTRLGVAFRPPSYPAQVETLRVYFSGSGTGTVHLYHNNAQGRPNNTPAWQLTTAVTEGWNTFPINPPLAFVTNRYVTAAVVHGASNNVPLGRDGNPPNAASIQRMDTVGWQYSTEWTSDAINGNWCIQLYVNTALRPPTIVTSVDTLRFDTVAVGANRQLTFWIRNSGESGDLRVTRFSFAPASIDSVYNFDHDTLRIAPGDSQMVTMTFAPHRAGTFNGRFFIENNSPDMPRDTVRVFGVGVPGSAADDHFVGLPQTFSLGQNYPNPFNPSTEIEFALPTMTNIRLSAFNLLGQEIAVLASGKWEAGRHRITWDATGIPAGVYFYRLEAGDFTAIRKMMLLK